VPRQRKETRDSYNNVLRRAATKLDGDIPSSMNSCDGWRHSQRVLSLPAFLPACTRWRRGTTFAPCSRRPLVDPCAAGEGRDTFGRQPVRSFEIEGTVFPFSFISLNAKRTPHSTYLHDKAHTTRHGSDPFIQQQSHLCVVASFDIVAVSDHALDRFANGLPCRLGIPDIFEP